MGSNFRVLCYFKILTCHIFINMSALWCKNHPHKPGPVISELLGTWKFVVIYLLTGAEGGTSRDPPPPNSLILVPSPSTCVKFDVLYAFAEYTSISCLIPK
jgi:membrane associated rhomboid family serine protease